MNTIKLASLSALCLLALAAATPAAAHGWGHHGPRVSFGINLGIPLYGDYYPGYYPGYYPVYQPAYYPAPAVIYQTAPTVVAPPPSQVVYQYYCPTSQAYYPAVPTCSQPWLRVVPDGTTSY